ncbi:hypothetical protein NXH76_16155 [Blautia schinkii]|nr:hypothetical protein [Blautia schinkii]
MIAVINDISFQYPFTTKKLAIEYVHKFLDICKRIKKEEMTNVHEIKTGVIDTQKEISPGFKLIQLLQDFQTREERTFLLGLLTNQGTYHSEQGKPCKIGEKESSVCAYAIDNILISLLSNTLFEMPVVRGIVAGAEISLRNLSKMEHINHYRKELGLRRYIANNAKHKFDRENPYGKGRIGSRMDLHDEEAQELLNKAVEIKGRLYAKKNGYYYAFQNERDIDYHGYRIDDLGDDIKRQLVREFA